MQKNNDDINTVKVHGYKGSHSITARVGRHYCPQCKTQLLVRRKSVVIDPDSEDAKNFDFTTSDGSQMLGNIQFSWDVFFCECCNSEKDLQEVFKFEKMNKRIAVKYLYNANPFFVYFKKHSCPKCKAKMELRDYGKVVNYYSPKAKDCDFSVGDTVCKGDMDFRTRLFFCPECHYEISLQDMKQLEKTKNK